MGGVSKGFNRALGLNRGGTLNRAFGGNQNLAVAIAVVASVAIPFAAPAIAGAMLGSTAITGAFVATSTAVGAGLGAVAGAASGSLTGNVGRGALLGGAGGAVGGFGGGGGFGYTSNALFGSGNAEAAGLTGSYQGAESMGANTGYQGATGPAFGASEGVTPGVAISPGGTEGVVAGGIGSAVPPSGVPQTATGGSMVFNTGSGTGTVAYGPNAGQPVAPQGTQVERFLGGITGSGTKMDLTTAEGVGRALSPIVSPSGIAGVGQLAMTMYNRPPESLTPQERSFVNETAELAGTNRALFEQRVNSARRLLQQGTPNPEEAYAQASMGVQRRFREAGLRDAGDVRRGLIEGARLGAAAIPGEYTRAASLTQAGLSAMPSTAPQGAEGMALPVYRDLERRQREYQADLGRGFGTLASAFGGRSKAGLFG